MDPANAEQTVWFLISATLVMLTLPGVALFYGGMVRTKNVLNTMGLPLLALVLSSLEWVLWGEAMVFGLPGAAASPLLMTHTFAASLALALIAGSLVERTRFVFFLVFGVIWLTVVYMPVARWLWGGGWLARLGSLDFAGGAVVHITAGVTAVVAAIMVGPRRGYGRVEMMPHNIPLSVCGGAFLWVGWCGFSAGWGITAMSTITGAFVAVQAAAAAAALTWTAAETLQRDKPTVLGTMSGAVAGLVAIAPAAGYVGPLSAIVIGVGAGGVCYMVVNFVKPILRYDDSLDVFGMHAVGGTWGMIATGLFASSAVNPDGSDGLFYGYPYQFGAQLLAVAAVWAFTAGMTFLLMKVLQFIMPPRVDDETELIGLDLTQHGERGYST